MNKYVKPELFVESFELTQHIVACTLELNLTSREVCGATGTWEIGGGVTMSVNNGFSESPVCEQIIPVQGYCYYAGTNLIPTSGS